MATTTIIGKIGTVYKNEWSATDATYNRLDEVSYLGSTYRVILAEGFVPVGTLPTNETYFKVSAKGFNMSEMPNKSVTTEKTTFIESTGLVGRQIFNKNQEWTPNARFKPGGVGLDIGPTITSRVSKNFQSLYRVTGKIAKNGGNNSVAFYDSNFALLAYFTAWGNTAGAVDLPVGAVYYKIQIGAADNADTLQIESGTIVKSPYEAFDGKENKQLDEEVKISESNVLDGAITPVNTSFIHDAVGVNIFDKDQEYLLNSRFGASGNIETVGSLTSKVSKNLQLIPEGITNLAKNGLNNGYVIYDKNEVILSTGSAWGSSSGAIALPVGFKYFRIQIGLTDNEAALQIIKGTIAPVAYDYKAFTKNPTIDDTIKVKGSNITGDLASTNPILINLAPVYHIAQGRTIEIYHNQISWCGNINDYHFLWSGVGKSLKRKWSMTGVTIGSNLLTLKVYDNRMNLVHTATTSVVVVSNIIASPFTAVLIGDSLANGKPYYDEITTLSANKITFVGTRGGLKHEGRSGYQAAQYLTNSSYTFDTNGIAGNDGRAQNLNPFFNTAVGKFDWNYYKSNYNQNPGRVLIWLGTNGISLDPTINVNSIKGIVDGIRESDANIPIYVINTLFRANQNGIGVQLGSDGYQVATSWKLEEDRKVFNLKVALNAALVNYPNVKIVPLSDCHDSENNFGTTVTPVNPRASQTELMPTEATHPQTQGYLQAADIFFSSLAS